MTTDANGWPDASKPGVPQNPERDGWHWVCAAVGIAAPYPMLWSHDGKAWDTGDGWEFCTAPRMTERTRYLGPALLPAEVAAREAAAAKATREACAQEVDCGCAARADVLARLATDGEKRASYLCLHGNVCCALQAATIRALPIPDASALDAMRAKARRDALEEAAQIAQDYAAIVRITYGPHEDQSEVDAAERIARLIRKRAEEQR